MENDRRFEIANKIISVEQIIDTARYIEKTKDYYNQLIKSDLEKNQNTYFENGEYKYYTSYMPKTEFTINYTDGREVKTADIYVFEDALKEPKYVKKVTEQIYISYKDNELGEITEHSMSCYLTLYDKSVFFNTSDKNMSEQAYNMNSYIRGLLESGEDRYSGVIKNRFFIKNIIGLSIGLILTLVIFFILLALRSQGSETFETLFVTPFALTGLGWLCAFAFGSFLVAPIIDNLYKEIDHDSSSVYAKANMDKTYKNEYSKYNEILIGENYNNLEKRKTIEKLFNISKKVILARLAISIIIIIILAVMQ